MSKIRKMISDALELDQKRGESDDDYRKRLCLGVSAMEDAEFDTLSPEAQEWANIGAQALNEGKATVPPFPDEAPPPAATTSRRTRATAEPEPPRDPQVGDTVTAVTARKSYTGELVELADDVVVINVDGEEQEVARARITSFSVVAGTAASAPPPPPRDPQVGDTVKITTVKGKIITAKLTELDADALVAVDSTGETHELARSRVASMELLVTGSAPPAPAPTRRGAAPTPAAAEGGRTRTTKSDTGGMSVGMVIRTVIVDHVEWTQEQVAAELKRQGLDVKDNTLALNYADAHKMLKLLKEKGKLK